MQSIHMRLLDGEKKLDSTSPHTLDNGKGMPANEGFFKLIIVTAFKNI